MSSPTPLVAIRCITYNHAPYIRQCLDGFVMQRTDFAFVAIVHDDCSTDGTDDIVREYAQRYPNIIKPIFETENQYSKGDGSLSRIMTQACNNTSAKYIAMCEGDDYWTDPLKLQKQVDFLENHPEYVCSAHNAIIKVETSGKLYCFNNWFEQDTFSLKDIITKKWLFPTQSLVFRNDVYNNNRINASFFNGDLLLQITLCRSGGLIHYSNEFMSVYRSGIGVSMKVSGQQHSKNLIKLFSFIKDYCPEEFHQDIDNRINSHKENLKILEKGVSFSYRIRFFLIRLICRLFHFRNPEVKVVQYYSKLKQI